MDVETFRQVMSPIPGRGRRPVTQRRQPIITSIAISAWHRPAIITIPSGLDG
jgi:hypothetical protein